MEAFIERLESLMKDMHVPMTFQEAGIPEDQFLSLLDEMTIHAFDDQCTLANPRFPTMDELKVIMKNAYYGVAKVKEEEPQHEYMDNDEFQIAV